MDSTEASVKGVTLIAVVDDVNQLVLDGLTTRDELETLLKPDDVALLDEEIVPGLWYPVAVYARLLQVLCDKAGGGGTDYLVRRGETAAERILAAGAYASLVETAEKWGGDHLAKAIINLSKGLYNFTEWNVVGSFGDTQFELHVTDAAEYPEVARYAAEGFIRVTLSRTVKTPFQVSSRRAQRDRVIFTITHEV